MITRLLQYQTLSSFPLHPEVKSQFNIAFRITHCSTTIRIKSRPIGTIQNDQCRNAVDREPFAYIPLTYMQMYTCLVSWVKMLNSTTKKLIIDTAVHGKNDGKQHLMVNIHPFYPFTNSSIYSFIYSFTQSLSNVPFFILYTEPWHRCIVLMV